MNLDPCTSLILDFIASHESTGNYNAVIGDAHATDDLSRLALAGIYRLQDQLVASGRPSSAVGRYQIIKATLLALQTRLKLGNDELFTPELQDRLAVQLLIQRGYPAWWRGEIDDREFAHRLSMEWASLPDPEKGGKSHYDGVGPNHAGTTLAVEYAMLRSARALIPSAPAPDQNMPESDLIAEVRDAAERLRDALNRLLEAIG